MVKTFDIATTQSVVATSEKVKVLQRTYDNLKTNIIETNLTETLYGL